MKKILASLICISLFSFSVKAQVTADDIQGHWILSSLEGNDTARVLTAAEIQTSTSNYLHDFPLTSTTFTFTGADFTMTHHGSGSMSGTFDVADPALTLHVQPDGCSTCAPKNFNFIIRSSSSTELSLDIFDEDEGSSTFAHLTFTK